MGRVEIEIAEQWSFVGSRQQEVWTWTAVERGSSRVVGLASGARSEATCRALWQSLPADYRKRGIFYTDEYYVYRNVPPLAIDNFFPNPAPTPLENGPCVLNDASP